MPEVHLEYCPDNVQCFGDCRRENDSLSLRKLSGARLWAVSFNVQVFYSVSCSLVEEAPFGDHKSFSLSRSEYSSFWRCIKVGAAYLATQLLKVEPKRVPRTSIATHVKPRSRCFFSLHSFLSIRRLSNSTRGP